jgi:hypothetical protein
LTPEWRINESALEANPTTEGIQRLSFAARVFTWMETFARIRTKGDGVAPFRMNTVQQILAQYVARRWYRGVAVRVATPKSRQQGSSTFWTLLAYALCELQDGYHAALVAHVEDSAEEIFAKAHTVKRELNASTWGQSNLSGDQAGAIRWVSESGFVAATIKSGDALGRGPSNNLLHFSESASYADKGTDAKGAVIAILNSQAENWLTIEVHESTAKGKDPFFWPLCEAARNPASGSSYEVIFLPWFLSPEYSMSWEQYRRELLDKGKDDPGPKFLPTSEEKSLRRQFEEVKVRPEERLWRYQTRLTDDQFTWRRWATVNKCWGDQERFKREYPSTYEEAFTASAKCFFEPETVEWYRTRARDPIARGHVNDTGRGPAFISDPGGPVHIWEFPRPGAEYVLGADIGGLKPDSDFSCAYVVNKNTHEAVAAITGHFEWDHFMDHCYELGLLFNTALLVVENNQNPASANRCHRRGYPNLYYYFVADKIDAKVGSATPGFSTNKKTKPELLNVMKAIFRDRLAIMPDPKFYREMETFVWVPNTISNPDGDGEWKALKPNHDDRIMAAALAYLQCPIPEFDMPHRIEQERPSRAYLMFQELQRLEELGKQRAAGDYLNLSAPRIR